MSDVDKYLNKITCIDALELLADLPDDSVDMVLCDLPYGITAAFYDSIIPLEPIWIELKRIVKPKSAIVLTSSQPFTSRLVSSNYEMFRYEWIWEKNIATGYLNAKKRPLSAHESVLVFGIKTPNYYPVMEKGKPYTGISGGGSELYNKHNKYLSVNNSRRYPKSVRRISHDRSNPNNQGHYHPNQKPLKLFEYLIKTYTQEGEIVLDMTCGSGTTAHAAMNLGRHFICGDYHQPYVDIARDRLQRANPYIATVNKDGSKQLSLFEELE